MKLIGETNRDDARRRAGGRAQRRHRRRAPGRYVHSPGEALVAGAVSEQDVIRPAFIYKPAKVQPVGQSDILFGTTEFANAREPLAQAFKPKGALDSDGVRGDRQPLQVQGRQHAAAPATTPTTPTRAPSTATGPGRRPGWPSSRRTSPRSAASTPSSSPVTSTPTPRRTRCRSSTAGLHGDRVQHRGRGDLLLRRALRLARPRPRQRGRDGDGDRRGHLGHQRRGVRRLPVQPLQLQRHAAVRRRQPVRGLRPQPGDRRHRPARLPTPTTPRSRSSATNDFHGRLLADGANAAGAAVLAGAVKELRADNPNTAFVAAGDLIGASTFESFIQNDKPTIEALNEAGLDVSVGGQPRVRPGLRRPAQPGDGAVRATTNPEGGADWKYIAANVKEPDGAPRARQDLDPDVRRSTSGDDQGRLRRRGDRGPAVPGLAGRHRTA